MKRTVKRYAGRFPILNDWHIRYDGESKHKACCDIDLKRNRGVIYAYGRRNRPPDYFLHETLHFALRALTRMDRRKVKEMRLAEEELVRNICWFVRRRGKP